MIKRVYHRCCHQSAALVVIGLAVLWAILAIFAPHIAPYDPFDVDMSVRLQSSSQLHWLGTDSLGRDMLSRILFGARLSLGVAVMVTVSTAILGLLFGSFAAFGGKSIQKFFNHAINLLLSFPTTVLAVALIGVLGPSLVNVFVSLVLTQWAGHARITRTLVLSERVQGYVRLAPMSGISTPRLFLKYILPNVLPQLLVVFCQQLGTIVITVAGLSLIGVGVPPPHPEWGTLLVGARQYMQTAPWLLWYPGMVIFITVVIFNLLGDICRDLLDPYGDTSN